MNKKQSDGMKLDDENDDSAAKPINKPAIYMLVGLCIFILGFGYISSHSKSIEKVQTLPNNDESYTVPEESSSDVGAPQLVEAKTNPPIDIENLEDKEKALQDRLSSPLMITQSSSVDHPVDTSLKNHSNDPNTRFMQEESANLVDRSSAALLGSLDATVAQGSLIHAVLESAINSDLPGYIRAIVSEPAYAENGSAILIPVGSRLIGEYKSGMLNGQSRLFVVWTRLITPLGVSINLGSAGVDSLGVAGMNADEINQHFWTQFSSSALSSLIGAGASSVGDAGEGAASAYREAVSTSFAQTAEKSLEQNQIPPTLTIAQGKQIIVFVAKDLDFSSVPTAHSSMRIF